MVGVWGPEPDSSADPWLVAEPSPPPLPIDDFRLWYFATLAEESSVQMTWRDPGVGGITKVLRQIVPLTTFAMPSGFQAPAPTSVSPFAWTVVGVVENEGFDEGTHHHFSDEDIPAINESLPKAARRPLGSLYTYRLEVSGGERSARSPVLSTRNRGINSPSIESIAGISDSEIHVKWRDNSKLASGFRVSFFAETVDNVQVITINGTTKLDQMIQGLLPDTEYMVWVGAWDHYGRSSVDGELVRTMPAPNAEPEDMTFDLSLDRQMVYEGHIPYLGRFPTAGNLPSGTLRKVSLHSVWPALLFVKPGRSTAECDDPDAVVLLAPGTSLTAAEMTELFGAETPDLPIVFLACQAYATPTVYDWIPIRITYRPN
jgi:hypothetical protein